MRQSFKVFIGKYHYIQYSSLIVQSRKIYCTHPFVSGPHCYTVHADSYLRIEKPKKHVAKGRLFTLGSFSSQSRCTAFGVGSSYIEYIYELNINYLKEKLKQYYFGCGFFFCIFYGLLFFFGFV